MTNGKAELVDPLTEILNQISELLDRLDGDLERKNVLVELIDRVEIIEEKSRSEGAAEICQLAESWKDLLVASLLDQVPDSAPACQSFGNFFQTITLLNQRSPNEIDAEKSIPFEEPSEIRSENSSGDLSIDSDNAAPSEPDKSDISKDMEEPGSNEDSSGGTIPDTFDDEPEVLDFSGCMFDDSLIYDFIDDCESHLDDVESKILSLENEPENLELVDEIFRPVHSIKGSAGFLGVKVMQDFAHEAENLLDEVRKGNIPVSSPLIETILEVIDVLKTMLSQLREAANRVLGSSSSSEPSAPVPVRRVLSQIRNHLQGPDGSSVPDVDEAPPEKSSRLGEILVSDGAITKEELGTMLEKQNRPLGQVLVEEGLVSEEKVEAALSVQQTSGRGPRELIKVDILKLDELVNLVGELVISQTLVQGDSSAGLNENGMSEAFEKNLGQLGKITKEIQAQVMSLRMVPLQPVFQKMTRLVRDVSKKMGKKVELILSGEDTEVDKTVSELISDPLVHIIRNATDHGIESPEFRCAAGKEDTGKIFLSAYHEGGNIVIEIKDDGAGLSREKILNKAVKLGLVDPGEKISDSQVHQFIMNPGFSTAEKITDISGRGVGLDVVSKNIEELRGKIEVGSVEGKGSTFTIKLPLTLAIIDGMIVGVGREKFIIPTLSIIQTFRPEASQISIVRGRGEMVNARGKLMPLLRLYRLYDITPFYAEPTEGLTVIVDNDGDNYALLVDELIGQQQVVIKSMSSFFKDVKGIAGGTILGDGRVGLILDMGGIFEAYRDPAYYRSALVPRGTVAEFSEKEEESLEGGGHHGEPEDCEASSQEISNPIPAVS